MLTHDAQRGSDETVAIGRVPTVLESSPRINAWYERLNDSQLLKVFYAMAMSIPMASYNLRKEMVKGNLSAGIGSGLVSLGCNMLVSYEFCLKSPFLAAAILSEIRKRPKLALTVVAGLMASGALTAQLVHEQPVEWAVPISLAFLNYAATRLSGLVDNNRSWKGNLAMGAVGVLSFFPLVDIWMGDTASLFSMPSIPRMVSDHLAVGSYVGGSFAAIFGAVGSIITTLFYCQAISSIPDKIKTLYESWSNLLEQNIGFGPASSKILGGFLAMITAGVLGYVGYYSMAGFGVAVSAALQCAPAGELCWLSNLLDISSAWIDVLATFQQVVSGLVNTSALIPAFSKFVEKCTVYSGNTADNLSGVVIDGAGERWVVNGGGAATVFAPGALVRSDSCDSLIGNSPTEVGAQEWVY